MKIEQTNNPLHGKTLEMIIDHLVAFYGWEQLGYHINIKCFTDNPSVKSSLTFLRKTPWARKKVENLYLEITR
ncbi:MAG: VF530 family protein [Bacteroidota bacterium]